MINPLKASVHMAPAAQSFATGLDRKRTKKAKRKMPMALMISPTSRVKIAPEAILMAFICILYSNKSEVKSILRSF